jgi:hypothetical protein
MHKKVEPRSLGLRTESLRAFFLAMLEDLVVTTLPAPNQGHMDQAQSL